MKILPSLVYLIGTLALLCATIELRQMIDANTRAVKSMTACQTLTVTSLMKGY